MLCILKMLDLPEVDMPHIWSENEGTARLEMAESTRTLLTKFYEPYQ